MFDLRDIFELIVDGFNNEAFAKHELIFNEHKAVLHIFANISNELESTPKQMFEQSLR